MARFCSECGAALGDGARFCPSCGTAAGGPAAAALPTSSGTPGPQVDAEERDLWQGAPDPVLSPLSGRVVTYRITTQRIVVSQGALSKSITQIPLFRVKDVEVKRSLAARSRGVGTIVVTSTDPLEPSLKLEHVTDAEKVGDMLGRLVLEARRKTQVFSIQQ